MTATAQVRAEKVGRHVAILTLDRPDAHNAINGDMALAIERHVATFEADPDIRVCIFAASGTSFCAGADLREIAAGRGMSLSTPDGGFAGFVYAPKRKPWIAAVQGAALGGGTEIALSCDIVIAGEVASFGLTEVRYGLIAGAGGVFRLARILPRAIAIEMVISGISISAEKALLWGLVNQIVPTGDLRDAAIAMADRIAAQSPLAVRESLALARRSVDVDDQTLRVMQESAITAVLAGEDVTEGAAAFIEKRAPKWRT
jgi:enoyl-CoA hydratase/carnithine racemase